VVLHVGGSQIGSQIANLFTNTWAFGVIALPTAQRVALHLRFLRWKGFAALVRA